MAQQGGNKVISSAPGSTGYPGISTIGQPQVVIVAANLGRDPAHVTCPFCNMRTVTKIKFKSNSSTHAAALIGGSQDICCICLPYCFDCMKSAHHHCGHCGAFIGKCD